MPVDIPWYGGEYDIMAAKAKRDRQLGIIYGLTGAAGKVLGTMRQQREDEQNAKQQDARLAATLGDQETKATAENSGTLPAQAPDYGPGPLRPTDPDALKPEAEQPNALKRLGAGMYDNGIRALRATGGLLGLTDLDSPDLQKAKLDIATKQGQVGHQKLQNERLTASQGISNQFADPGEATYQLQKGDFKALRNMPRKPFPPTSGAEGGSLTPTKLAYAAANSPDPSERARADAALARIGQEKVDYKVVAEKLYPGNNLYQRAYMDVARTQEMDHQDWPPAMVRNSIDHKMVEARVAELPPVDVAEAMGQLMPGIVQSIGKPAGTTTTTGSGDTGVTPTTVGKPPAMRTTTTTPPKVSITTKNGFQFDFQADHPISDGDLVSLATSLKNQVDAYEASGGAKGISQDEAAKIMQAAGRMR